MALIDVVLVSRVPIGIMKLLGVNPKRIKRGFYEKCGCNFRSCLPNDFDDFFDLDCGKLDYSFGVCDTPDQFIERYEKYLDDSEDEYIVGFTVLKKCDQESKGGWRWSKWGTYIGDMDPKAEYLYDEPIIDQVCIYGIFRKKK